jgi:hydrogenase expression/formation protein HypE
MSQDRVLLAHGGGGELTRRLIAEHIRPRLANPALDELTDGALLANPGGRLCVTTDASVVTPLFFPGGDIGRLAVSGTVNDLAVMGATPLALMQTLVIEEGLPLATLDRVLDSIAATAAEAGVPVVAGDTKVVERRVGEGLFISTAGVGVVATGVELGLKRIRPGDRVLISGRIADHGLAVMAQREGMSFQTTVKSDVAPLNRLCAALVAIGNGLRFLRDPTRGGLAGVLADLAEDTGLSVEVEESAIPIAPATRHAAEMLGLDPLVVANEGKLVIVCSPAAADAALAACRADPHGRHAALIGTVTTAAPPLAELITAAGGRRIVQRPYGEELPRIC